MDNTEKSPSILSLCTGYGGIEIGLERVLGECTVLAHVEIEAFAIANLVDKMETGQMDAAPVWTDVKTFRPEIFRGVVDILCGGYPCQPFSAAGKRKGTDDPRHLWPYIETIIDGCQPRWAFFENVEGHISLGLCEVLASLESRGYKKAWGIFSAAEVGAPHQRKRVFILAHHKHGGQLPCREQGWVDGVRAESPHMSSKIEKSGPYVAHRIGTGLEGYAGDEYGEAGPEGTGAHRPVAESGLQQLADSEQLRPIQSEHTTRHWPKLPANGSPDRWPSRPGEPQYEWEEPRVVADTPYTDRGAGECKEETGAGPDAERGRGSVEQSAWETQSQLGRAVDGATDRVDRLRLLGNGVVPQTAEKAFRVLYDELMTKAEPELTQEQMAMF